MRDDIYTISNGEKILSLRRLLGRGYDRGWFTNCHCRYRLFAGARSTKKSKDIIGYESIMKILDNPLRNIVIIRQNDTDNRQSTFENICGCIEDLGMSNVFKASKNPLTIEYLPTGQLIIFRGFNSPTSLNSITFSHGYWTDTYIEEAFELSGYDDFRKLDGSMRGILPQGLFFQMTLCFNAWDGESWLNKNFFENRLEDDYEYLDRDDVTYMDYCDPEFIGPFGKGLYLHKSTYKINEFRDKENYDAAAKEMKRKAPEIYKVEFLGMFGNTTQAVYPEYSQSAVVPIQDIIGTDEHGIPKMDFADFTLGIDTGLSDGTGRVVKVLKDEDPNVKIRAATTMTLNAISRDLNKKITIDEYFHSNNPADNVFNTDNREKLELPQQADALINYIIMWMQFYGATNTILMKGTINVYVDSADLGFRQVLAMKAREFGLFNINFIPSTKISIQSRVDFNRILLAYGDWIISDKCKNLSRELKNARRGKKGEAREDGNDHVITAEEYGSQPLLSSLKRWKSFKQH